MSDYCKWILSPFTERKKRKPWKKTWEKYLPEERRQNLVDKDRGSYYNPEQWLEEFLDDKAAFYNGSKVMIVVMMMMRFRTKTINSSSYLKVLPTIATK